VKKTTYPVLINRSVLRKRAGTTITESLKQPKKSTGQPKKASTSKNTSKRPLPVSKQIDAARLSPSGHSTDAVTPPDDLGIIDKDEPSEVDDQVQKDGDPNIVIIEAEFEYQ
jgi:hypothetical protein